MNTNYSENLVHPMVHPNVVKTREAVHIVSADGVYLTDDHGNRLLDAIAGLWCVNVGHNRPEVKAAITRQLDELQYFQLFNGSSHPRVVELAELVREIGAPEGVRRVFFSSGGSDANETAMKIARQYHRVCGQPERTKFISLKQGYHGTHFGTSSISGGNVYRRNYEPLLPGCSQLDTPWHYRNPLSDDPTALGELCAAQLEREIQYQMPDTVAAFIAEPCTRGRRRYRATRQLLAPST